MAARKEFEVVWQEAGRFYATPQDTSAAVSTGKSTPKLSYRRETSPGGTVHEYYADGTEKEPDESTSEPIRLGRRIVLGYAHPARVAGLTRMHHLYGAESNRLNATFEVNDSDPEVEFLNRAGLRAVPEEELGAMGQLARVFPSDDPAISARTRQILEDFYKERGIPNPAELELLFKVGRAPLQRLKLWFAAKERRLEPYINLLDAAGIKH